MEKNIRRSIEKKLREWKVYYQPGSLFMKGCPDLTICHRGIFIALEIKMPGRYLAPMQRIAFQRIRRGGGIARRVDSVKGFTEFWDLLNRYLDDVERIQREYIPEPAWRGRGGASASTILESDPSEFSDRLLRGTKTRSAPPVDPDDCEETADPH